jgi:hypothetical protein
MRAFLAIVLALVACGAETSPLVGVDQAALPTCQEAVATAADASAVCVAAAALVSCAVGEVCISNDPKACNGVSSGCSNQCTGSEYAMACNERSGAPAAPPASCRAMDVAASGTRYYCCPCTR